MGGDEADVEGVFDEFAAAVTHAGLLVGVIHNAHQAFGQKVDIAGRKECAVLSIDHDLAAAGNIVGNERAAHGGALEQHAWDTFVITGENFGTKECFHTVTFSAASSTPVDFTFIGDSAIEATVPDARAGMSFVIIVAGGGSAQSKPVLIKSK